MTKTTYNHLTGSATPLGASIEPNGVNFSVFSEHAQSIELCLFDDFGQDEIQKITMERGENHCWHIFVEGLSEGAKYGYRAHGPFEPEDGHRFNANKLLIDPYARKLDRDFCWSSAVLGYDPKDPSKDLSLSDIDSASVMPKSIVCHRASDVDIAGIQSRKPNIAWSDTVVYETHVRGFTQLNLNIPSELRGTFAGLAHRKTIDYLKKLGITTIELLPVHSFIDEEFLVQQGLSNYWGYNTLSFFSPHTGYLSSDEPKEFLDFVEAYHAAGLEVILDVVYNHTAESNHFGPTLNFRGLDNYSYYRLEAGDARHYVNDTGCGNTVKVDHPRVMQLVTDSLRFWAGEMGVDGFRFDLASILGRNARGYTPRAAFFQAISQDPLLAKCKMIAEPWDIGPGGYQLGNYPGEWSEWNDKYRDICRRFWKGDRGVMPEFARRIHGSSDLFEHSGRRPRASLNFICSHDGFTLADTVAYRERNNIANKENNRDGHHSNFSENYGAEGKTKNESILEVRRRQQRNFLATLFFSQGTPMLLAGDELGRSQGGNNNAYCQDNEINWLDWAAIDKHQKNLNKFSSRVLELRKQHGLFRSDNYIHQPENFVEEGKCARWVSPAGLPMTDEDWHKSEHNVLGWILESLDRDKHQILLTLFNASTEAVDFVLPKEIKTDSWALVLDTYIEDGAPERKSKHPKSVVHMQARTLKLLTTSTSITTTTN